MFSVVTDHPDVPGDAPIIGLDHVILAVSDLEAAQAKARKLGFTTTDITAHVGWGTANTCVMVIVSDSRIEPEAVTSNIEAARGHFSALIPTSGGGGGGV